MRKYQLSSGKVLEFNLAGIEQALELYRAVISECKNAGLNLELTEETQFIDLIMKNKEALLNIFGSKNVMDAVLACCNRVLYNKQRFTLDLFEDECARGDFRGCMTIIGVENISPFFPALRSFSEAVLNLFLKT